MKSGVSILEVCGRGLLFNKSRYIQSPGLRGERERGIHDSVQHTQAIIHVVQQQGGPSASLFGHDRLLVTGLSAGTTHALTLWRRLNRTVVSAGGYVGRAGIPTALPGLGTSGKGQVVSLSQSGQNGQMLL